MNRGAQRGAVQDDPVVVNLLSEGGDSETGAEPAGGHRGGRPLAHAGAHQSQAKHVAIRRNGQLADIPRVDELADRGVVSLHQGRLRFDGQLLRHLADFQLDVDAGRLIDPNSDAGNGFLAETGVLDDHFVSADVQRGRLIIAAVIGFGYAMLAGAGVTHGNRGATNDRACVVRDRAQDGRLLDLCG